MRPFINLEQQGIAVLWRVGHLRHALAQGQCGSAR